MKKVFKRAIPFVLVVVMCLCMAAPAFAAMPDEDVVDPSAVIYYYKVISENGAYMRYGPSTDYSAVTAFAYGTYLYYIGYTTGSDGRTWIHLGHSATGYTGWIRGDLVEYDGYYTEV